VPFPLRHGSCAHHYHSAQLCGRKGTEERTSSFMRRLNFKSRGPGPTKVAQSLNSQVTNNWIPFFLLHDLTSQAGPDSYAILFYFLSQNSQVIEGYQSALLERVRQCGRVIRSRLNSTETLSCDVDNTATVVRLRRRTMLSNAAGTTARNNHKDDSVTSI
jgi:hypothetical protein